MPTSLTRSVLFAHWSTGSAVKPGPLSLSALVSLENGSLPTFDVALCEFKSCVTYCTWYAPGCTTVMTKVRPTELLSRRLPCHPYPISNPWLWPPA